jgi:hypothetical protein
MHSLPTPIFALEPQNHKTSNAIETLRNLMYLIRLDAADPDAVVNYVEHADAMLEQMERMISGTYPC